MPHPTTARPRALPLVDDALAAALHLDEPSGVLFRLTDATGSRMVTKRPLLSHESATAKGVATLAARWGGTHRESRWRWYEVVAVGSDGAAGGLRVVTDWRDGVPLLIEVAGGSEVACRRELELLTRHFGPGPRPALARVVARVLLWAGAALAVWLSAMRILQSTPVAAAVSVAMYASTVLGLVLLAWHVARNALPPRRARDLCNAVAMRRAIGWAWLGPATVLVLRAPVEPYVGWLPGWLATAGAAVLYGVASAGPGPLMAARPRGRALPPGWDPVDPRSPVPAAVAPAAAWRLGEEATAAFWPARVHLPDEASRWNATTTVWDSAAGTVTAHRFDTWDGGPLAVVELRALDRTLVVRSRDPGRALSHARTLADRLFTGDPEAAAAPPAEEAEPTWAPVLLAWWVCLLTLVIGSDLGPSHYQWLWPEDVVVEHHYPVLGALSALTVALTWGWTMWQVSALFAREAEGRSFRRAARLLAWQLTAVWTAAQVLTLTLLPVLARYSEAALRVGQVLAVANLVALAAALTFLLVVRPESAAGLPRG